MIASHILEPMAVKKYPSCGRNPISTPSPVMSLKILIGIFAFCVLCGQSAESAPASFRQRQAQLKKHLLSNYSKAFAPSQSAGELLPVTLSFTLESILDLNAAQQVLTTLSYIKVVWTDPDLAWDSTEAGSPGEGIEVIGMTAKDIWVPRLMLLNRVASDKSRVIDEYESIIVEGRTGFCIAQLPLHISTTCQVDVTHYPFDTQHCRVMFASLPGDVLNVSAERLDVPLLETFDVSGEWEQIDFTVIHSNLAIELHNISHDYVEFQLTLRRYSTFYALTVIFPIMLLSITGACGFLLPLQCGEKVNFQVAIMVSLAVFLGFIYDAMPKTSLTVSRLAVYVDMLLMQSCLSFLATTVVLRGHYHHEKLEQDEKDEKYLNAARGAREPGEQTIKREDDPAFTPPEASSSRWRRLTACLRRKVRRWYCGCCCVPPSMLDIFFFLVFVAAALLHLIAFLL